MRIVLSVIVVAAALALGGCCGAISVSGVVVEVTDADTGLPVAATVTIADGDYVEILDPEPDGHYAGAWDRAGTYEIEVIAVGYQPASRSGVVVEEGRCNVDGVRIEIALVPAPPPP